MKTNRWTAIGAAALMAAAGGCASQTAQRQPEPNQTYGTPAPPSQQRYRPNPPTGAHYKPTAPLPPTQQSSQQDTEQQNQPDQDQYGD